MRVEGADILVVDDQAGVRRLLWEVFSGCGYRVETAGTGEEALEKFLTYRPRLVILDLKLPGSNGVDILKKIRRIDGEVSIILMTGHDDRDSLTEAKGLNIRHCIQKPFDLNDMIFWARVTVPAPVAEAVKRKEIG